MSENDDTYDCWGYVRLSQDGRGDESIDDQKDSIRRYCRDRLPPHGQLVTTLSDGVRTSGFDRDRDAFQTLYGKIEAGEIDAVVVRDRAWLARDFDVRLELSLAFRQHGVDLHVTEELGKADLHDVRGAAMGCMKAAMDHSAKMAEIRRAREIVQQRRDDGAYQGRPWTGLTFDSDGQFLVPAEDEDWDAVTTVLDEWNGPDGESTKSGLARRTGLSREQVRRVLDRHEAYEDLRDGACIGADGQVVWPTRADGGD